MGHRVPPLRREGMDIGDLRGGRQGNASSHREEDLNTERLLVDGHKRGHDREGSSKILNFTPSPRRPIFRAALLLHATLQRPTHERSSRGGTREAWEKEERESVPMELGLFFPPSRRALLFTDPQLSRSAQLAGLRFYQLRRKQAAEFGR